MKSNLWLRACLVVMTVLLVWTGNALVRVENQRYAMQVGMCQGDLNMVNLTCLKDVQTRTGWWWHLYYALTDQ